MTPSPTRVASRHLAKVATVPDIRELMNTLNDLAELDENLSEYEDHVWSKFAATSTDVTNHLDALTKATEGIKQAKEVLKASQSLVDMFPDDKTAPRAVQAAEVMIGRFERHAEEARKIIRQIAKKELPADLKKAAAALKKALANRLVNPSDLQEIPWVGRTFGHDEIGIYQVYLVVAVPGKDAKRGILLEQRLYAPNARGYALRDVMVYTGSMGSFSNPKPYNLNNAVASFAEVLQGWSGLKGEAEATKGREQVAKQIAEVLYYWMRSVATDGYDKVEITNGGLYVTGHIRMGTRWESYSEWDADEGESKQRQTLTQNLKSRLDSLMPHIKRVSVNYGEKGHWDIDISLK